MKKLILIISLLFVTLGVVSCDDRTSRWNYVENTSVMISEIEYKGHTYIEFKDNNTYGANILHSPDCKCYKDTVK